MKNVLLCFFLIIYLTSCSDSSDDAATLVVPGLKQEVEVIRDEYGVNHIYAQNEHDLFFAQGYCAARDRLFQFEIWRRQASGTVAEILGERELQRDIGARLFKYRGDLKEEFNHYHPQGESIIRAFTDGINAFVQETEKNPELLPLEFNLLGIVPGRWTPELVISRHQGLLGNLPDELTIGRAVALLGPDQVKDLKVFEPGQPDLSLDPSINTEGLFDDILTLYHAFRKPVVFLPHDLAAYANPDSTQFNQLTLRDEQAYQEINSEVKTIGSNNWIVSGKRSASGYPLLANDPHRALAVPSLRYMVHLMAPGWNVVGGGEPTIPGVSIGHNEYGAWGLTVFELDGEDLMVYELHPDNANQYNYQDSWEDMTVIKDTIRVKGSADVYVEHKYTRHGPVTFVDHEKRRAYAVRCAWLEPGGAPYLASLRMDVAKSWEEFRDACAYSHIPGENMIWADKKGNIGWQVVGIAPVRKNWSGLVPVPGDGRYEWDGYLPIKSLPNTLNPEKGYWATANENLVPDGYEHRHAVGWEWADSSRANRVNEVLAAKEIHTLEDMMKLQSDYLSIPARELVPMLKNIATDDSAIRQAIDSLLSWNFVMDKNSMPATIYMAWQRKLLQQAHPLLVPEEARDLIDYVPLRKVIGWIRNNRPELTGRDQFMLRCLQEALTELREKLGTDLTRWQYGQENYHHVLIKHPLSNAVNDSLRNILNCGPLPRGGSGSSPGMTGNGNNQTHGATFRIAVDVADWDKAMFSNAPGQSGNAASPFYKNLFSMWADDKHFPVYFSKSKIEDRAQEKFLLKPL
jgi:penicillin G amidase